MSTESSSPITVDIQALTHGGACIGTIVDGEHAGKKAFVRGTAPGEQVRAAISKVHPRFVDASLIEVLRAHPARITPPCPYFERCGGCDVQHLTLAAQREAKVEMVRSALQFQAKISPRDGVHLKGEHLPGEGYRSRITVHVAEDGAVGFYREGSGEVVEINRCLIACTAINEALEAYRTTFRALAPELAAVVIEAADEGVILVLRATEGVSPEAFQSCVTARGAALRSVPHRLEVQGRTIATHHPSKEGARTRVAGHFSQVNAAGNEVLTELVLGEVPVGPVTELYAGSGNFTLPLARKGCTVTAVELDRVLTEQGDTAARTHGLSSKVTFVTESCERYVAHHSLAQTVVLDPPRAGAKAVVTRCSPARTSRIIYVSCSLPTFCRDAQILSAHYHLERVYVVDMFGYTHHVELVGVFTR